MLKSWRAEEPPISYTEIVVLLREHGVHASQETVRRWVNLLDDDRTAVA